MPRLYGIVHGYVEITSLLMLGTLAIATTPLKALHPPPNPTPPQMHVVAGNVTLGKQLSH